MVKNILFAFLASASFITLAVAQPSPVWPGPASTPTSFDCSKCDVYPTGGGNFICKNKGLPGQEEGQTEGGCNANCKPYRAGTQFAQCIGKGTFGAKPSAHLSTDASGL